MATLNWIGKDAVVNHREVPCTLLRGDPRLSVGEDRSVGSGSLLVQSDNLLALKALSQCCAGRVYKDNTKSSELCEWIGKVGGRSC